MTYINDKIDDNSILIFEYFTATGEKDNNIISEAEVLILSLLDDLKTKDLYLIIHESYKGNLDLGQNVTPIFIEGDLESWLIKNSKQFSKAIFISGEDGRKLSKLSKILEDNEIKLYCSSFKACEICSDKFKTYEKLLSICPQPKTSKIVLDYDGAWMDELTNIYNDWKIENPFNLLVLKPNNGVDCDSIMILDDLDDINENIELVFPLGSTVLIQEYIEGEDVSVSLISDGIKTIPISFNKQLIEFGEDNITYVGGKIPYNSEHKYEAFYLANKAIEVIGGIKGFVGVDFKINKNPRYINDLYLLEINSRFTTPYVGLKKIANFNIGSTILDLIDENIKIEDINVSLEGEVSFRKENNSLTIIKGNSHEDSRF